MIGVFDSGFGGLTVHRALLEALPDRDFVYLGDNRNAPYGVRPPLEVLTLTCAAIERLFEQGCTLAVIACNTASTIALDHVRAALDLPVVGTVPAIKPAAELSKSRVIGVLGTEATVRQPYVDNLAAEFAADCTIVRHGSPELVALAEAKLAGDPVSVDDVRAAAQPLFDGNSAIDTVVLACTHFPLLADELQEAFPGLNWIDGGAGIARRIAYLTREQPWPPKASRGIFVATGAPPREALLGSLARFGLDEVQRL